MNAREKLNVIFLSAALLFAIFGGISCQSWLVFFAILFVAVILGLGAGSVRL